MGACISSSLVLFILYNASNSCMEAVVICFNHGTRMLPVPHTACIALWCNLIPLLHVCGLPVVNQPIRLIIDDAM